MRNPSARPLKRPYSKPTLVVYGDVLLLTRNKLLGGRKDGGKGFKGRTR
jgi:hypothetical protein